MKKLLIVIFTLIASLAFAYTYEVKTTAFTVTTVATALPTTPMTGRVYISVQNLSDTDIYVGGSTVTTANGILVSPRGMWRRDYDHTVLIYGRTGSGSANVRVEEGK